MSCGHHSPDSRRDLLRTAPIPSPSVHKQSCLLLDHINWRNEDPCRASTPSIMDSKSAHSSEFSYYPDFEPQTAVSSTFQEKIALEPSRRWSTRPARPPLLGLIPAAAVIIATIGFVAAILGVLLGRQCHQTQGGSGITPAIKAGIFYTTETHEQPPNSQSHLWVLTISGLAVSQPNKAPCKIFIILYRASSSLAQALSLWLSLPIELELNGFGYPGDQATRLFPKLRVLPSQSNPTGRLTLDTLF